VAEEGEEEAEKGVHEVEETEKGAEAGAKTLKNRERENLMKETANSRRASPGERRVREAEEGEVGVGEAMAEEEEGEWTLLVVAEVEEAAEKVHHLLHVQHGKREGA
jgi:hypothetical protein